MHLFISQNNTTTAIRKEILHLELQESADTAPSLICPSATSPCSFSTESLGLIDTSDELSVTIFGLTGFLSLEAGRLLLRNSNNLSSFLFSVLVTLGGVLEPDGGNRGLMGTVGPPVVWKQSSKVIKTKGNLKQLSSWQSCQQKKQQKQF